jgi:hypothetical protein
VPPRFAVRRLEDVPRIEDEDPADPDWYALQHYFRLTAFGVNVYVAPNGGLLIATHDESRSNQEELYIVTSGEAVFTLDGTEYGAPATTVVAVPDPTVVRSATARTPGTAVVAIGGEAREAFPSSWQPKWFEGAPQV